MHTGISHATSLVSLEARIAVRKAAHVCMIACPNSDSTQLRRSCLSLAEAAALNCEEQRDGGEKSGRMGRAAIRENLRAPAHRVQV